MTERVQDLQEREVVEYAAPVKLFGKWAYDGVKVEDNSLNDQICLDPKYLPHTAGRWQKKRFRKMKCPIVERFTNCLMMHGRNSGKKLLAVNTVKQTLEIVHTVTKDNPLAILVKAIENAGPREDSTRVGSAGVVRRQAVDVSPLRRVNNAMALMISGARRAAFRNIKSLPECLADEIMLCSQNNNQSYAIKKKIEIERVAASNR